MEELRAKAAEAKTGRGLRNDFEELADARQKEIEELNRRLASLRTQLKEETKRKQDAEDNATERDTKLKALSQRLGDLKSYIDS